MLPLLFHALSPAGPRARLSVLIFHRVLPAPDPLFPDEMHATRFETLCAWLRDWFEVLPLPAATARLRDGSLPARALAITFDDGYADNHDVALPILQRHGLPATFFVATGFLDGGRMWNDSLVESVRGSPRAALDLADLGVPGLGHLPLGSVDERRQACAALIDAAKYMPVEARLRFAAEVEARSGTRLPADLMMRSDQVRALHAAGMTVGGHTVNHPILARLDRMQAAQEIRLGKERLESIVQAPVRLFAYPNGRPERDYNADSVAAVRDLGFDAAFTTAWGSAVAGHDAHQLPRFTPWDQRRTAFGLRMAKNLRVRGQTV